MTYIKNNTSSLCINYILSYITIFIYDSFPFFNIFKCSHQTSLPREYLASEELRLRPRQARSAPTGVSGLRYAHVQGR